MGIWRRVTGSPFQVAGPATEKARRSRRAGSNKFHLRGRAERAAALDLRGGATELTQVWRG